MNRAHDVAPDPAGRTRAPESPLASWYTPGTSDGLGDRLLMFDNTDTPGLELLRFRRELAAAPGFERALRESVERLLRFRHPAFADVRAVEFLDGDEGLALVSAHTPGKRLAEMFQGRQSRSGMHPAFVTWLVRQLTPAVFDLQAQGRGLAHGVLTAERIVLTTDGHLMIVEHVVGAALGQLRLSARQLWDDLGVVATPAADGVPRLDARNDLTALGLVALSVLLGRRVTPEEYPSKLGRLLDEFTDTAIRRSPALVPPLRLWLERVLRVDGRGFDSTAEACDGLDELPGPRGRQAFEQPTVMRSKPVLSMPERPRTDPAPGPPENMARSVIPPAGPSDDEVFLSYRAEDEPAAAPPRPAPVPVPSPALPLGEAPTVAEARVAEPIKVEAITIAEAATSEAVRPTPAVDTVPPLAIAPQRRTPERPALVAAPPVPRTISSAVEPAVPHLSVSRPQPALQVVTPRNLAIAAGIVAVIEAGVLVRMATRPAPPAPAPVAASVPVTIESPVPGDVVMVNGHQVGVTPYRLNVESSMQSIRVYSMENLKEPAKAPATPMLAATAEAPPVDAGTTAALAQAAARQRSGGIRISSPIEIQVIEGDRVLGTSTDGPIVAAAGVHQLDFINSALGFRLRQSVEIKSGTIAPITVKPPDGKLSVNATPWAQVWVDGTAVGETPLANLTVSLGQHDVLFRHPQLGEKRDTVLVKAGVPTRISAALGR